MYSQRKDGTFSDFQAWMDILSQGLAWTICHNLAAKLADSQPCNTKETVHAYIYIARDPKHHALLLQTILLRLTKLCYKKNVTLKSRFGVSMSHSVTWCITNVSCSTSCIHINHHRIVHVAVAASASAQYNFLHWPHCWDAQIFAQKFTRGTWVVDPQLSVFPSCSNFLTCQDILKNALHRGNLEYKSADHNCITHVAALTYIPCCTNQQATSELQGKHHFHDHILYPVCANLPWDCQFLLVGRFKGRSISSEDLSWGLDRSCRIQPAGRVKM